jgi:hypothetical protein
MLELGRKRKQKSMEKEMRISVGNSFNESAEVTMGNFVPSPHMEEMVCFVIIWTRIK